MHHGQAPIPGGTGTARQHLRSSPFRQRIDEVNRELIDALAEVCPRLAEPTVQQALSQRAEEILTGDGLAEVRETAIAPLQRGPRK